MKTYSVIEKVVQQINDRVSVLYVEKIIDPETGKILKIIEIKTENNIYKDYEENEE